MIPGDKELHVVIKNKMGYQKKLHKMINDCIHTEIYTVTED